MPVVLAFFKFSIPRDALTGFRFLSDAVALALGAALDLDGAALVATDSRMFESRCFWSFSKLEKIVSGRLQFLVGLRTHKNSVINHGFRVQDTVK